MKTIFLMYLLIIPVCLQAQIEQYTRVLEPSVLVCQYECVKKVDTLGTDKNCETMILRIGKKRLSQNETAFFCVCKKIGQVLTSLSQNLPVSLIFCILGNQVKISQR